MRYEFGDLSEKFLKSHLNSLVFNAFYKCRQDYDYNTDPNAGNYRGLYQNGCREQLNGELDDFLNIFSISGIVIGCIYVLVSFFSICVCICPRKNDEE